MCLHVCIYLYAGLENGDDGVTEEVRRRDKEKNLVGYSRSRLDRILWLQYLQEDLNNMPRFDVDPERRCALMSQSLDPGIAQYR